jgi:hypothetical protein
VAGIQLLLPAIVLGRLQLSNVSANLRGRSHGVLSRFSRIQKTGAALARLILLPVIVGLAAKLIVAFYWFRDVGEPAHFVNQLPGAPHLWEPHVLRALAENLGTGFQFASVGFIFIAAFFALYIWDRATLPIHLPAQSISDASISEDENRRTKFFVWMMIAMVFITGLPEPALEMFSSSASSTSRGCTRIGFFG